MNHEQGCAECTDWGNGNCASGCFGPVCTCTEVERMTVCHDIRNEPHLVGCPRWGTPIAYASGGHIERGSLPDIENPTPYVIPLGRWGYLVSLADEDDDDGYDEGEAHAARHPWWFPGCADCDERADAQDPL